MAYDPLQRIAQARAEQDIAEGYPAKVAHGRVHEALDPYREPVLESTPLQFIQGVGEGATGPMEALQGRLSEEEFQEKYRPDTLSRSIGQGLGTIVSAPATVLGATFGMPGGMVAGQAAGELTRNPVADDPESALTPETQERWERLKALLNHE